MRFNVFVFLSLLLFSSIGATEQLVNCEFNSQLGTSICHSKTEKKPYQIFVDLLQSEINDYIQEYEQESEKKVLKDFWAPSPLFSMYAKIRAEFSLTEEKTSEVLWQLNSYLSSFDEYLLNQEKVLNIIFLSFHALGENPSVFYEFAEEVFSTLSQFLSSSFQEGVQTAGYAGGVESRHHAVVSNKFSKKPDSISELHNYMVFLVSSFGKKVKAESLKQRTPMALNLEFPDYSVEQIEKALQYLDLTWLHGTKAYALKSAHFNTEDCFVPSGILFQKKVAVLTGTIDVGASPIGINKEKLSGLGLSGYSEAISYALMGSYSVELEEKLVDKFLNLELGSNWLDYVDYDGNFTRMRVAIDRLRRNNAELFESKRENIEEKISDIYQALAVNVFGNEGDKILKRLFFNLHDSYHSSKFYSFLKSLELLIKDIEESVASGTMINEEQNELLSTIPTVIASFNRLGIPIYIDAESSRVEQPYFGSLKLGEEIQVVFVPEEDLQVVEELVREIGLEEKVRVESLLTLYLAGKIEECLFDYLYDPYVLPGNR